MATPKDIMNTAPAPWRFITHPNGLIQVFDAAGKEVPLLTVLDFVVGVTSTVARPNAPAAA